MLRGDLFARAVRGLIFALLFLSPISALAINHPQVRVLLVLPDTPAVAYYSATATAIREAMLKELGYDPDFFTEMVEMTRFRSPEFQQQLADLMIERYRLYPPDVVITGTGLAIDFLTGGERPIFPKTPIIALAVTRASEAALPQNVLPVWWNPEVDRVMELAMQVHPGLREVTIVTGQSRYDLTALPSLRRAAEKYAGQLQVAWLTDHSMSEIETYLARVPRDSAVVYTSLTRDREGVIRSPQQVLKDLSRICPAPIYCLDDAGVGNGAAAGMVWTYAELGDLGGKLAAAVVKGARLSSLTNRAKLGTHFVVDWEMARHHGLDLQRLPPGTRITNRPRTLWEAHKLFMIGAVASLCMITAIAAGLISRARYRQANEREKGRLQARMASFAHRAELGEMAVAIAHELNQPLAAILSNAETAELWLGRGASPADLLSLLRDIRNDDERASLIIQRLRSLYGNETLRRETITVADLILQTTRLIEYQRISSRIALRVETEPELPLIEGDRMQLQQALYNIINNAIAAMNENSKNSSANEILVSARREGRAGVRIDIADRGIGVDPAIASKLFEPFFTTKPGGTGLGLPLCKRIAEAHGGQVTYTANPEGGSIFSLHLPSNGDSEAPA